MRRARVCGTCFNGAIHIVPAVTTVKKGVDETKIARREASDVVKAAVKKLRGMSSGFEHSALTALRNNKPEDQIAQLETRAAALGQAADILEAGDF